MNHLTKQLQQSFDAASRAAELGNHSEAVQAYRAALITAQNPMTSLSADERAQFSRSIAFNLAQSLNLLGQYREALEQVEAGLTQAPSAFGKAVALAAKGEALCGLQRLAEGRQAFEEAVQAHPVIGRLNSADSMVRLGHPELIALAEKWINRVADVYGDQLDQPRVAELAAIRRRIANRRVGPQPSATSDEAAHLAERALQLARIPGKLTEAADMMEKAFTQCPPLRYKYEYQVTLWRKGLMG